MQVEVQVQVEVYRDRDRDATQHPTVTTWYWYGTSRRYSFSKQLGAGQSGRVVSASATASPASGPRPAWGGGGEEDLRKAFRLESGCGVPQRPSRGGHPSAIRDV